MKDTTKERARLHAPSNAKALAVSYTHLTLPTT